MPAKKVIHVLDWPGIGGIESFAASLASLQGDSVQGFLFNRCGPGLARFLSLQKRIVIVESLLATSSDPVRELLDFCSGADVLHLHSMYLELSDIAVVIRLKVPVIATLHSRSTMNKVDFPVVCLSESIQKALSGKQDCSIIENGVDCARFYPGDSLLPNEPPIVIRLSRPERVEASFWEVMRRCWSSGFESRVMVIGEEGTDQPNICYLGFQHDVAPILRQGDILLHLPSTREEGAHDLAVLEAMATGMAIISIDVRSVTQSLENGVTGLLYAPEDVDGIVRGMQELLLSADLRRMLGKHARRVVEERFSLAQMAGRYETRYEEAISAYTAENLHKSGTLVADD